MKIGTNPIGNYNPVYKKAPVAKAASTNKVEETTPITNTEKAFFSNMYPDNKTQIERHHFYMKNGNMTSVVVGSLIDRRG